jgi:hypothetical protein
VKSHLKTSSTFEWEQQLYLGFALTGDLMKKLNNIFIESTSKTPQVDFNCLTGDLILLGKSIPENAAKVYEPVLNWVTKYTHNARPTTNVRINFEYFNTSSSLWLAKIFKVLVRINEPDYVLIFHLYLPVDEFDELEEFDDIKEAFYPIADVLPFAIPSIGFKVYGTDDDNKIIKDKLVFI